MKIWTYFSVWAASWENQPFAYAKTKTQKLISAFVFATWIVQFLFFLNLKFQASSHLQWLYSLACVRPGQNPHCWFSHAGAHRYGDDGKCILHMCIRSNAVNKQCYWLTPYIVKIKYMTCWTATIYIQGVKRGHFLLLLLLFYCCYI